MFTETVEIYSSDLPDFERMVDRFQGSIIQVFNSSGTRSQITMEFENKSDLDEILQFI